MPQAQVAPQSAPIVRLPLAQRIREDRARAAVAEIQNYAIEAGLAQALLSEPRRFLLSQLSPERRVQIRDEAHYIDRNQVQVLVTAIGQGDYMPPLVVTRDLYLISGSHRLTAFNRSKVTEADVIIVDIDWESADAATRGTIEDFAGRLNNHGVPSNPAARLKQARAMLETGKSIEEISRSLKIPARKISPISNEMSATDKLLKLGFEHADKLDAPALSALGRPKVMGLHNAPWLALATLSMEARFKPREIEDHAGEMDALQADDLALNYITEVRETPGMQERIRRVAIYDEIPNPPAASAVSRSIGAILRHEDHPELMVETSPVRQRSYYDRVQRTVTALQMVLSLQPVPEATPTEQPDEADEDNEANDQT